MATDGGAGTSGEGDVDPAGEEAVLLGLGPNGAAAFAYSATFLTGFVVYLAADDEFARFHAAQSVVLFGGLFAVDFLLGVLGAVLVAVGAVGPAGAALGAVSDGLLAVAVGLWVLLFVAAFRGRRLSVPLAGRVADAYA